MMLCALSGEPAKEPVVSPKSGAIFERKLVESYIATAGKDPVNDEPLTLEDLIPIKSQTPTSVPPRPPAFNSIPTMLAAFQNEWDALALETYTLRKQLHNARQELSETLYQYDAAVRVAARAIKERDEAQAALLQLSESFATLANGAVESNSGDGENGTSKTDNGNETQQKTATNTIPVDLLSQARDQLFALHKKQKISLPITKTLKVEFSSSQTELTVHDAQLVASNDDGSKIVVAAAETAQVYPDSAKIDITGVTATTIINNHGEQKAVAFAEGSIVDLATGTHTSLSLETVTAVVAHPSEPLFVALTSNNEWALCDEKSVLFQTSSDDQLTTADLHVDGVLLGVGSSSGTVSIYDLTLTEKVSTISTQYPHVDKLQFGLNGYWLAVTSSQEEATALQIFDLRKNSLVHQLSFDSAVDFVLDPSCLVLSTYEKKSKTLLVHTYIKKGKLWVDHAGQVEADFTYLVNESSAQTIQDSKTVKLAGVGDKNITHYEISII